MPQDSRSKEPSLQELLQRPEIAEVRPLLARLLRETPQRRVDIVRKDSRYHTSGSVAMLFTAAEAVVRESPAAASQLTRLAVEITAQLRQTRHFAGDARELHALALAQLGRFLSYTGYHLQGYRRLHQALDLSTDQQPLHPATRTLIHWALASYNSWQGYLPAARDHVETAVDLAFRLPIALTGRAEDSDPAASLPDPFPLRHSALFGRMMLDLRQDRLRRRNLLRDLEALSAPSLVDDSAHAAAARALLYHGHRERAREVIEEGLRAADTAGFDTSPPHLRWLCLLHGDDLGVRSPFAGRDLDVDDATDPRPWIDLADEFVQVRRALEAVLVLSHGLQLRLAPARKTGRKLSRKADARAGHQGEQAVDLDLARRIAALADHLTCSPQAALALRLFGNQASGGHLTLQDLRLVLHEVLRAERAGGRPFPVYHLYWRL